jgi:hypothetical protein
MLFFENENMNTLENKINTNVDTFPSSLLDPSGVQVSQTAELSGTRGTLLALNTKRGRGAC